MSEIKVANAKFGSETIESALYSLWGEVARDAASQFRRRMVNVIIVVADSRGAATVSDVIHQVAQKYSGRYFVVVLNPDPTTLAQWESNASMCQVAVSESGGMSYERIVIPYAPGQAKDLPSCLQSLLLHELPVVLWWRYIFNSKEWLFEELSRLAERVIIDSITLKNPAVGMDKILEMSQVNSIVRDISWARIKPWRLAVAGFYDVASYRPFLTRVTDLKIEYSHQPSRQNAVNNSQVLLLFGWLASRLKWRPVSNLNEDIPDCRYTLRLDDKGRDVRSYFTIFPALGHLQAGVKSICLTAAGDPAGSFLVNRCDDNKHIMTRLSLDGLSTAEKVTCLEIGEEADLIAGELLSPTNDEMYREALEFLKNYAVIWSRSHVIEMQR